MNIILLFSLLILGVSCSKGSSFSKASPSDPSAPAQEIASPEVQVDLEIVEDEDEDEVMEDEVVDDEAMEDEVVADQDAEVKKCELLSENERQEIQVKLKNDKAHILALESDKLVVEGYTFNPSMNENAAVLFDGELSYQGKKVLKITSRVVFDKVQGLGELQISYRLKEKKASSQTDFLKLASIEGCVE